VPQPLPVGDALRGRGPRGVRRQVGLGGEAGRTSRSSGRGAFREFVAFDESDVRLRGGHPARPIQDDDLPLRRRGTIAGPLATYVSTMKAM